MYIMYRAERVVLWKRDGQMQRRKKENSDVMVEVTMNTLMHINIAKILQLKAVFNIIPIPNSVISLRNQTELNHLLWCRYMADNIFCFCTGAIYMCYHTFSMSENIS